MNKKKFITAAKDVINLKRNAFIEQLKTLETKPFYQEMAAEILDELSPEEALSGLLQLRCGDIFSKRNY